MSSMSDNQYDTSNISDKPTDTSDTSDTSNISDKHSDTSDIDKPTNTTDTSDIDNPSDKITQTGIHDQSTRHFDNILSVAMSILGATTTLTHKFEIEAIIIFIIYYLNDIRKTTKDFVVHHILSISVCLIGAYLKLNNFSLTQFREMVLYMELSAPIYTFSLYVKNPIADLLFLGWFIYCRIYKQYYLLNNLETQREVGLGCIPYCFLFGLNLYWIFRGLKRLFKPFKDPVYKLYCYKLIPFIRPFELSLINFYSSIASYLYYENMSQKMEKIKHKNDQNVNDQNVNELLEIQVSEPQEMIYSVVNSLVSISSIEPCYYKYSLPIHLIKFMFHLDEEIPIGIDTLFYFSTDAIIIYYLIVLFKVINAFYNITPLATHLLLIKLRTFSKVRV